MTTEEGGRRSKEQILAEVHEEAMHCFNAIQSAQREERRLCLQDRRFATIPGSQWEGPDVEQFENTPRLEINKIHLACIRILNEYRNNRITVDFTPKDGQPDELSDVCDGLYRADEQDSGAQEAYDNGFDEASMGGFGAWRLRACYEDEYGEDDDRQRIRMEPIFDADTTVFFDLGAKRQDKADAKKCFVLTAVPIDDFKEMYPEDDPASWPRPRSEDVFEWYTPDVVFTAEYYCVEEKTELLYVFQGLALIDEPDEIKVWASELEEDEKKLDELRATGYKEVRQKRVKRKKVHKYILSGSMVLSDEGLIAGDCIPIIPVFGKRWVVDTVERCMGHVRLAKDAQRLKNMTVSKVAEIAGGPTVEKPMFDPSQVDDANIRQMWADDNIKKYPFLLRKFATDAQGNPIAAPTEYTKAPNLPPALAALVQIIEQDVMDLLGNAQAGEEMQPNQSGKAVELIQQRLDMQVYIYMDNMRKAMQRCGEVWLSMAKDLYTEEGRKMKTVSSDSETGSVELLRPVVDKSGAIYKENDLSKAAFDVRSAVGPSSSSKRSATVRAVTGLVGLIGPVDPQLATLLTSVALMNIEGEGLGDLRDYIRAKLVRQGVVKPTEEEKQQIAAEQANAQPDPQADFLVAEAEKSRADSQLKSAQTIKTLADAKLSQAKTVETLTSTGQSGDRHAMEADSHQLNMAKGVKELTAPPEQPARR